MSLLFSDQECPSPLIYLFNNNKKELVCRCRKVFSAVERRHFLFHWIIFPVNPLPITHDIHNREEHRINTGEEECKINDDKTFDKATSALPCWCHQWPSHSSVKCKLRGNLILYLCYTSRALSSVQVIPTSYQEKSHYNNNSITRFKVQRYILTSNEAFWPWNEDLPHVKCLAIRISGDIQVAIVISLNPLETYKWQGWCSWQISSGESSVPGGERLV